MFRHRPQERGHELVFRFPGVEGGKVELSLFGEKRFDNLIVLAQSLSGKSKEKETAAAVTVQDVMGFIEDGGALLR